MEKSGETFEIRIDDPSIDSPLTIRPEQTSDGAPIYHCYQKGDLASELRREATGEWKQLWGELDPQTVGRIGAAIEREEE